MVAFVFCILQVMILVCCDVKSNLASGVHAYYNGSYVDHELRRIIVYCTARGKVGDTLSWYQTRGSENKAISTVPHTNTASNEMKLTLNLPVNKEFSNSSIFCVKTSESETPWISSNVISLTFQKDEFITVTPAAGVVIFDDTEMVNFFCSGSEPRDGRKLTWYMQRPGAKPYAQGHYDNKKYINNLVLRLNESYDGSRLYCAQAYVLYKVGPRGNFYDENRGPTLRSNTIRLVQRKEEKKEDPDGKDVNENTQENFRHMTEGGDSLHSSGLEESSTMLVTIPIGVIALLFVLAMAAWLRRRRAPERPQDDDCIFATPQVLYATLDLQNPTTEYASSLSHENSPYAKIIGIYRPNTRQ